MVITYFKGKNQPGKVANPARGQMTGIIFSLSPFAPENLVSRDGLGNPVRSACSSLFSLSPFAPENLVSRDGLGNPIRRQPAHLYTQAESGA